MEEGWPLKAVCGSAGLLHAIRHARWTAGEHANLWQQDVVLLEAVEELVEVRTTKVGDGAQTSEETASRQLLEVPLADVLKGTQTTKCNVGCKKAEYKLTSMVVRRSNLSKNWVMKMWFSTSPLVSASSTSLMMSANHSHCFWLRVTQMKNT